MTQDDYKLMASVFKSELDRLDRVSDVTSVRLYSVCGAQSSIEVLVLTLADTLEQKYPDFDRDAFLNDCGIN